jgi:hypothetical protein
MFIIYIRPDLALVGLRDTGLSSTLIKMQFQFQKRLCRICGRQNGTGTNFSLASSIFPVIIIPPLSLTHILTIYYPAIQCQKITVPLYKSVYTYT